MKIPRKINYCEVTKAIAKNPKAQVSEHLPDKQMFTVHEFLLFQKHVNECKECDRITAEVLKSAPKEKLEDRIKNEN